MKPIPAITESELWIVNTTLRERYGKAIEVEQAQAEIRLSQAERELTTCPILYWEVDKCHFTIFKTADRRYRCMFFYKLYQQYGTGRYEYDDLTECVVSLLQVQADYSARERGDLPN
jgi:hypothetical protein